MKKLFCLLLAFALLLTFGCKKDDPSEIPTEPTEAPAEQPTEAPDAPAETPTQPQINTRPDLRPDFTVEEVPAEESDDAWTARFNSYREVGYFMEWQLGEGYTVLETLPGDADGEYLLWGMHILEPGLREPFQMRIKVTPDGKDFSLLSKEVVDVTEEWKAVQNYRWLVTNLNEGPKQLLEAFGFDTYTKDGVTNIPYADFQAAMLSIMTQEMYDAHWADFFWEQDGKLAVVDVGGSGDHYLVEMVQPQSEGGWLSYEFIHGTSDDFATFFVKVDLEEQPNGTYRVSGWDPHNTELMEQAYTAMPLADGAQTTPFPVPTGEKMGLTGEDAALYTVLAKALPADPETLILLSGEILGSYPGEDGETHYVCALNESHFHDAALSAKGVTYSGMGGRGYLSRVTVALDGLLEYTLSTEDGTDNAAREKEIFGPLTQQYTAWTKGEAVPGARQLLPKGEDLLELYKAAYFPEN